MRRMSFFSSVAVKGMRAWSGEDGEEERALVAYSSWEMSCCCFSLSRAVVAMVEEAMPLMDAGARVSLLMRESEVEDVDDLASVHALYTSRPASTTQSHLVEPRNTKTTLDEGLSSSCLAIGTGYHPSERKLLEWPRRAARQGSCILVVVRDHRTEPDCRQRGLGYASNNGRSARKCRYLVLANAECMRSEEAGDKVLATARRRSESLEADSVGTCLVMSAKDTACGERRLDSR